MKFKEPEVSATAFCDTNVKVENSIRNDITAIIFFIHGYWQNIAVP